MQNRRERCFVLSKLLAGIGKTLRSFFKVRVKAGRGRRDNPDDGAVGTGVTVPLKPPPPVLVGKEAKTIPTGDDDDSRSDLAA
jgi:hypothetical protein